MPYIKKEDRPIIDKYIHHLEGFVKTEGELNYTITRLVSKWIADEGLCYKNINSAIGVIECVKQELYRRVASPYEDTKIVENGDVYEDCIH